MRDKDRERRLRRTAQRQGFQLATSRRRDPEAPGFGGYLLRDWASGVVVAGSEPHANALDLDGIDAFLNDPTRQEE